MILCCLAKWGNTVPLIDNKWALRKCEYSNAPILFKCAKVHRSQQYLFHLPPSNSTVTVVVKSVSQFMQCCIFFPKKFLLVNVPFHSSLQELYLYYGSISWVGMMSDDRNMKEEKTLLGVLKAGREGTFALIPYHRNSGWLLSSLKLQSSKG